MKLQGKRAAVYARYSSELQDDMSIDAQLAEIRRFAEQHQLQLSEDLVFTDRAVSGRDAVRAGLKQLTQAAGRSPRPFDVVLIWSWSRLARRKELSVQIKKLLRAELGLAVLSVSEPSDPDTTAGFISEGMHELMDELYIRRLAADTRRGQRQAVTEGFWAGGSAPFGYKLVRIDDPRGRTDKSGRIKQRSILEKDELRAGIVERIFSLKASGMGDRSIANTLNSSTGPTPRSGSWGSSTIRSILLNPIYIGEHNHGRRSFVKGPDGKRKKRWNPEEDILMVERPELRIVCDEDWQAVQEQFAENKRNGKGKPGNGKRQIKHLFSSLIRCGAPSLRRPGEVCGAKFVAVASTKKKGGKMYRYVRYICGHRHSRGKSVCNNMTVIAEDKLARQILDVLEKDLYSEANIQRLVAMTREILVGQITRSDDLRQEIEAEIAQLDREIANFNQAIAAGGNIPVIVAELKTRTEERDKRERQLAELQRLVEEEQELDNLEAEVRERIKDTLKLIRDTDSAPAFQQELNHHVDSMTALPEGLLKIEGRLVGALPMTMVAGAGFEPATSGL